MSISEIATTTSAILQGLGTVLTLFFVVLVASLPLGFLMTLGTRSRVAPLRWIINAYIYVMRGTPLMLQLFFIYYGLPFVNDFFKTALHSAMVCALIGFSLNYAAYFAEIFRGGISSIPVGQREAAQTLGLSRAQTFFSVLLPQTAKRVLLPVTNEVITLVKDTALASTIAVADLMSQAERQVSNSSSIEPYIVAMLIYLVINGVVEQLCKLAERKFNYYQ